MRREPHVGREGTRRRVALPSRVAARGDGALVVAGRRLAAATRGAGRVVLRCVAGVSGGST
jgi:hypothetical protein